MDDRRFSKDKNDYLNRISSSEDASETETGSEYVPTPPTTPEVANSLQPRKKKSLRTVKLERCSSAMDRCNIPPN